jgi:hypothetical protein
MSRKISKLYRNAIVEYISCIYKNIKESEFHDLGELKIKRLGLNENYDDNNHYYCEYSYKITSRMDPRWFRYVDDSKYFESNDFLNYIETARDKIITNVIN